MVRALATSGTATSAAMTANTTFTLTCTGRGQERLTSVTVTGGRHQRTHVERNTHLRCDRIKRNRELSSTNATSCTASGAEWCAGHQWSVQYRCAFHLRPTP